MSRSPSLPAARTSRLQVVLIAGEGLAGVGHTVTLLDRLPTLRCPTIVCLRHTDLGPLAARVDGAAVRWVEHGAAIADATVWIALPGEVVYVRDGAFEVSPSVPLHDGPSLGKIYHSLRVAYGSRVFAVVVDPEHADTPHLRLLVQRGARVVSPIDCTDGAAPEVWPMDRIVDHLGAEAAIRAEVIPA